MSGFDADWLALREPADHASINAGVRRALLTHFAGQEQLRIVDIGCGAGSNLRGLAPWFGAIEQDWTLVDYDAGLLARAAASAVGDPALAGVQTTARQADLNACDLATLFEGADLVTAAAFFDLASRDFIERLAEAVTAAGAAFYTVLTYDGIASWLPEHPADTQMRRAFNRHQGQNKGLGLALGPDATDALSEAFDGRGYFVQRGRSAWVLTGEADARLRCELEAGWANAVAETGDVAPETVQAWRAHRSSLSSDAAVTIVGHEDLLALPRG